MSTIGFTASPSFRGRHRQGSVPRRARPRAPQRYGFELRRLVRFREYDTTQNISGDAGAGRSDRLARRDLFGASLAGKIPHISLWDR